MLFKASRAMPVFMFPLLIKARLALFVGCSTNVAVEPVKSTLASFAFSLALGRRFAACVGACAFDRIARTIVVRPLNRVL